MDASVLSALAGLIGVAAGAAATFGGVVYQQRHGAREAKMARLRGEAVAAAEKILAELLTMQHRLRLGAHTEDEWRDYLRVMQSHHATIQLHSQWLPDAELRSRLAVNALYTEIGPPGLPHDRVTSELACSAGRVGRMSLCPSLIRRSSARTSCGSRGTEARV
ncbi:hypothetical protein ABZX39_07215 [Streptomyces collinus]|uniref:hypothetical protein n=1 Tax=Streptomyces collinus TaxID=42684 RepID=UPI0033A8C7C4